MGDEYKDVADKMEDILPRSELNSTIIPDIMKKLVGVKDKEERARFFFWYVFDHILNEAVAAAEKGDKLLVQETHGRLFNAIHIIESDLSGELQLEAMEHLEGLEVIDWYLIHHDSEHHGVIALILMRFYRRIAEARSDQD